MFHISQSGADVRLRDDGAGLELLLRGTGAFSVRTAVDPPRLDAATALRQALRAPLQAAPVHRAAAGKRVALLLPDATRGLPDGELLAPVLDELAAAGVAPKDITAVIATGLHRAVSEAELQTLRPLFPAEVQIVSHDAYADDLVYVGTTSRGTALRVNRAVFEANYRLAMGPVTPHEFAGFSGARKYVLPGVASAEAINSNHRPEHILSPQAIPGVLEGNPVSEDMWEAAELLGVDFGISTVPRGAGGVAAVFCGSLRAAHQAAVAFLRRYASFPIPPAELLVVSPDRPLDIDLYQSIKSLIALGPVLRPGMTVLLCSACREGVGSTDMLPAFQRGSPEEIIREARRDYNGQKDHAILMARLMQKGVRFVLAAPGVDPAMLGHMFAFASRSPDEAVEYALGLCGPSPHVVFCPHPQNGLPWPEACP